MREVSERMRDEEGNLKRKTKAWGVVKKVIIIRRKKIS